MGFCFNRQLRMLHDSISKSNKNMEFKQTRLIRNPVIRRKTSRKQQQQLSAEDYGFLKSIGLKVRK